MLKNPFLNSIFAIIYIFIVVGIFSLMEQVQKNEPDTILAPLLVLSLLTLSVVVMAYLFFYKPLQLFIENKKKEALDYFSNTLVGFAIITVIIVLVLFTTNIR